MSEITGLRRWLPHPWLSVWLAVVWLLLANSLSAGHLVMAALLALVVPAISRMFWPEVLDAVHHHRAHRLLRVFLWDLLVANLVVALRIISFWRTLRPAWIVIPLDLRNPTGITVLANMITLTPGTVSAKLTADRLELLVHVLDTDDPEGEVNNIKQRYERPLQEIFE